MKKLFQTIKEILTTGKESEGLLYVNPKGKLTIEERLKVIKYAKKLFIKYFKEYGRVFGMCYCIDDSLEHFNIECESYKVYNYIPEFRYENFKTNGHKCYYWWPVYDQLSRLKAFNLLIRSYKHYLKTHRK